MKIFISADIEGTNGIAAWEETEKTLPAHGEFAIKMAEEVNAVCLGINDYDPKSDIYVKDAHDSARNMNHKLLPINTKLIRGWAKHPYIMMYGLDNSFDASILTGYHSPATFGGTPLAHTMSTEYTCVKLNDEVCSEFLISYYTSLYEGVPVAMVSGDKELCKLVKEMDKNIHTVITNEGFGGSVTADHPFVTNRELQKTSKKSLKDIGKYKMDMPKRFKLEISYKTMPKAVQSSYYPGAVKVNANTIRFESDDYFEILRMFLFA